MLLVKRHLVNVSRNLEEQLRQQQPILDIDTKRSRILNGPSFAFDSSRNETKVLAWLCKVDTQICKNEKAYGEPLDEEEKLIIVDEHLEDAPLRQYHNQIQQNVTCKYDEHFVRWMRSV